MLGFPHARIDRVFSTRCGGALRLGLRHGLSLHLLVVFYVCDAEKVAVVTSFYEEPACSYPVELLESEDVVITMMLQLISGNKSLLSVASSKK